MYYYYYDPTVVIPVGTIRWIRYDGSCIDTAQGMVNNVHISKEFVTSVTEGTVLVDISVLAFRDPRYYKAGELHEHKHLWTTLLQASLSDRFTEVLDWIDNFINVENFFTHFNGSYKGVNYNCNSPPARVFPNHLSCKPFAQFISDTIMDRLAYAISLWGRVGACSPPHLVMPLTVEPSKPRLCNDNRFLNLWIEDRPFTLDSVQHLPSTYKKTSTKPCVMISLGMTTSSSLLTAALILVSSGVAGSFSALAFPLVGKALHTFITQRVLLHHTTSAL